MSEVARHSRVTILVSDFANSDMAGKVNVVGGTVAILGFDPMQGTTTRFSLTVITNVPSRLLPAEFSVEVTLMSNGQPVLLPGVPEPQALRVAQPVTLGVGTSAPTALIRDHIGANHVTILDFGNGLPLAVGGVYEWHVRIDGDDEHVWTYPLAVAGPPPGPVFG